jgi:hypothetical protein
MRTTKLAAALAAASIAFSPFAVAQDGYTYQGVLSFNGVPATGTYELRVELWTNETGGSLLSSTSEEVTFDPSDRGVFTLEDLPGGAFRSGSSAWMQLAARPITIPPTAFADIGPRRLVAAAPRAVYAIESGTSLDAAHKNGADIDFEGNDGIYLGDSSFTPNVLFRMEPDDGAGLLVEMFDDAGLPLFRLGPNGPAGGAAFELYGPTTGGMQFSALAGDSSPFVSIFGQNAFFRVETNLTGDGALLLPFNSVSPIEMLGEPGLAHNERRSVPGSGATADVIPALARSITVPGPGYVLVLGSASFDVNLAPNEEYYINFGISDQPNAFMVNGNIDYINAKRVIRGGRAQIGGTAGLSFPVSTHHLFTVFSPGTYTYYLLQQNLFAATAGIGAGLNDYALTLIYIPTAYGQAFPDSVDRQPSPGGNASDLIAAERDAELRRYMQQMQDELAEQRRIIEQMQRRLDARRPD